MKFSDMLYLIVGPFFLFLSLFIVFYFRFLKKVKKSYYAVSYSSEIDGSKSYHVSFEYMHGEYKKGSELSNFEKKLLPENTRKYLTKTYRSEGEAYKAVKFLEAC